MMIKSPKNIEDENPKRVLISEDFGGIGDMLTFAAAVYQYKQVTNRYIIVRCSGDKDGPRYQILSRCEGIDDVIVRGETANYDAAIDLSTVCAEGEVRELPIVNSCRCELYSRALGITPPVDMRPRFKLMPSDYKTAIDILAKFNAKPGFVGLAMKAGETYKDWEPSYWYQLRGLLADDGISCLAWGGELDEREMGIIGVASVVDKASCIVSADTMFLHLAGALRVPAVGIFGPSGGLSRIKAYPRTIAVQADIACSPCWRNAGTKCEIEPEPLEQSCCMRMIGPEIVAEAIKLELELYPREGLK